MITLNSAACTGCGTCAKVCPQGVIGMQDKKAFLAFEERCMECGACQLNCPTGAITVDSGVGCAAAMIRAALTGSKEPTCGSGPESCCGTDRTDEA